MFSGRIVEQAQTEEIFTDPRHPYTRSLLDAIPVMNPRDRRVRTFQTRDALEAATPHLRATDLIDPPAPGGAARLVSVAPGHLVEAIVT
jgi:ABC-type oligopeptide transport system ATPase subunit